MEISTHTKRLKELELMHKKTIMENMKIESDMNLNYKASEFWVSHEHTTNTSDEPIYNNNRYSGRMISNPFCWTKCAEAQPSNKMSKLKDFIQIDQNSNR